MTPPPFFHPLLWTPCFLHTLSNSMSFGLSLVDSSKWEAKPDICVEERWAEAPWEGRLSQRGGGSLLCYMSHFSLPQSGFLKFHWKGKWLYRHDKGIWRFRKGVEAEMMKSMNVRIPLPLPWRDKWLDLSPTTFFISNKALKATGYKNGPWHTQKTLYAQNYLSQHGLQYQKTASKTKCSSLRNWLDYPCIYTVEFYAAVKRNEKYLIVLPCNYL